MSGSCSKSDGHFDFGSFLIGLVLAIALSVFLGNLVVPDITPAGKRLAVKHGAAVWITTPEGGTEWRWKDEVDPPPIPPQGDPFVEASRRCVDSMDQLLEALREQAAKREAVVR